MMLAPKQHGRRQSRARVQVELDPENKDDALDVVKQQAPPVMYTDMPSGEATLDYLETIVIDRINLHHELERCQRESSDWRARNVMQTDVLAKHRCLATRVTDRDSFHMTMMATMSRADTSEWFVRAEAALLRVRVRVRGAKELVKHMGFEENIVTTRDAKRIRFKHGQYMVTLTDLLRRVHTSKFGSDRQVRYAQPSKRNPAGWERDHYKVPFERALAYVSRRQVLVREGFAYVPEDRMTEMIVQHFRLSTEKMVALHSAEFSRWQINNREDPRTRAIRVAGAARVRRGLSSFDVPDGISDGSMQHPGAADQLMKDGRLPLCMTRLMLALESDSHLKYDGRRQLNLFLRDAGMPLNTALEFWRTKFSRKFSSDQFKKQYAYNFEHDYGKQGARKRYNSHTCGQLMFKRPGAGQFHGCPYALMDRVQLHVLIVQSGVRGLQVLNAIKDSAQQGTPTGWRNACMLTTKTLCPDAQINTVDHPLEVLVKTAVTNN